MFSKYNVFDRNAQYVLVSLHFGIFTILGLSKQLYIWRKKYFMKMLSTMLSKNVIKNAIKI